MPVQRLFAAVPALLLFFAALFAGAGAVEDLPDGTTLIHLKVYDLPDPVDPDVNTRAALAVTDLFQQRFPQLFAQHCRGKAASQPEQYGRHNWKRVRIVLEKARGIRVEGAETDLLQIAGGLAPDVIYINFRKSSTYIENNFLYPLDEYVKELTPQEFRLRVHPAIEPVIRRKSADGRMHIWAMPVGGVIVKVMLYRKDLFDRHHLAYPGFDYTWERMLSDAKTITDPANGIYGAAAYSGGYYWLPFLWSAGGDVMRYNRERERWECVFGSRRAAIALEYYARLCAEKWVDSQGRIRRGYTALEADRASYTKWRNGEIAMMFAYINETTLSNIDPETTGMVPVPFGYSNPATGKRERGSEINSAMLGIFSEIKEPAVRDAAWEYIRFAGSLEALRARTAVMVEGGMGRFINPDVLRLCGGYDDLLKMSDPQALKVFETAIATGHPEPYGKNSNLAYHMMAPAVFKAISLMRSDRLPENYEARVDAVQQILVQAQQRANELMLGIITPRERLLRRAVAGAVLVLIALGFMAVFRRIARTFTPPQITGSAARGTWQLRRYRTAYLLTLPALLSILVWQYVPLSQGAYMAFFDYKLIGRSLFVGIDNFGDLLFDNLWWAAVWNSVRYSFFVVGLTFLPPILLAIALQEVPRGKLLYRMLFYMPAVITGIVTVLLWKQFYQPSEHGALNALVLKIPAAGFVAAAVLAAALFLVFARRLAVHELRLAALLFVVAAIGVFSVLAGLALPILTLPGESFAVSLPHWPARMFNTLAEPYRWLTDSQTAMLACVMPMVWAGMGPGSLIYLAALKGVPDEYYEAADIDGAGFVDKILFVVFPMLKALIIINFVGVFIQSWYGAAGNILVMTGGQANTETVGLHIWYKAFTFLKFGSAAAAAWMLGFMMIGFTMNQLRILAKVEFRSGGAGE